jgi:precorrin-2 dehydrogenase
VQDGRGLMVPVALDPAALAIAVAGQGPAAMRRFQALRAAGASDLKWFTDQPGELQAAGAAPALRPRLPDRSDLLGLRVLWIAGLPDDTATSLAVLARSERVLVNVEDRPELCDFHSVAEVRRGELLLTVSTGGASPALAARLRARLAAEFGPEWADRLALLREHRVAWRGQGRDAAALTDALLRTSGWLA